MKAYREWGEDKVIIDRIEPTHYFRNFLLKKIAMKHSGINGSKSVCEIGCGTGSFSSILGGLGFRVYALDLDENAIKLAKRFNRHPNVVYSSENILEARGKKKYDMTVCIEVLEHIEQDEEALERISGLLKSGGILLMTVPIHEKYRREFDDRSGHVRRYEPDDLVRKIKAAGFRIFHIRYFNFPFLWLWYFFVYLPYSDMKERGLKPTGGSKKRLPEWISILKIINKFFLIDLLFNSKRFSTDMLVLARKVR